MIAVLRSLFSFPLLTKELMERAVQQRTYWVRVGAALLLFGGFWFSNQHVLTRATIDTMSVLGAGRGMFFTTVMFLFVFIGLFVPAMLCGVITQEKERDSLVLLLLTRMRPWQIVVQKYLGGLIPALTLIFLAMPLVAVAYAYGGVTTEQVYRSLTVVVLAIFQVGAIAVWASCRFRTTVASFLVTYFAAAALYGIPPLLYGFTRLFFPGLIASSDRWIAFSHIPPLVFLTDANDYRQTGSPYFVASCVVIAATCLLFLLAAIRQLPRRAFDRPKNRLRRIFSAIDGWVHHANKWVGSVSFGPKPEMLPGESPIVWREKRARALARPEYLTRLLVVILIPVVFVSLFIALDNNRGETHLTVMMTFVSGLAILALTTTAANGIVGERINQTFEVLLTTPMSAAEILRQKARALFPLSIVLAIPILAVSGIEWVLEFDAAHLRRLRYPELIYPVCTILTVLLYFPLFSWFSIWVGLLCKTRIRAIVTTLVSLIIWLAAPIFVLEKMDVNLTYHDARYGYQNNDWRYAYLLSPLTVPRLNEGNEFRNVEPSGPWLPVAANVALYGGVLFFIRRHCLKNADSYLRR